MNGLCLLEPATQEQWQMVVQLHGRHIGEESWIQADSDEETRSLGAYSGA